MAVTSVLISGASVAGPSLAYWLQRGGIAVTVVERAPALRAGGHGVDFRGHVHLQVLERMGILDDVRAAATEMGEAHVVDEEGRTLVTLPPAFMSGDVEIRRGDLAHILHGRTCGDADYLFGDSVQALHDTGDGVEVTFSSGLQRTFDLVVGADGMHSAVRALVFGAEDRFTRFLGHYVAGFTAPNDWGLDHTWLIHNVPGRCADIGSARDKTRADAGFVFASAPLTYDRHDIDQQKQLVAEVFAGAGWEVPRMLDAMRAADDFYFDAIAQVRLDRWSNGRVVLLGDAACGATMGGLGTGLAVVGAYVLAGELMASGSDHTTAFARYEDRMRGYARRCQKLAEGAGPFLAPPTAAKIRRRNRMYRMLNSRLLSGAFQKMTTRAAAAIDLPRYPVPAAQPSAQ